MTVRPRAARALLDARTRLRDVAAASHARDAAKRDQSHLMLVEEQQRLDAYLDGASTQLASAASVYDLDLVGETTGVHKLAILDAEAARAQAQAASDASAAKLRESARKLRTAEALLERSETARDRAADQAEQRMNDDIAAGRR